MNTEKKEMTEQEIAEKRAAISAARSAAGKAGAAVKRANAKGRAPTKTVTCRQPDYEVISKWACKKGIAIAEAVHLIAETLARNDPSLR